MFWRKPSSVEEVVAWRLCVGCGACCYLDGGKTLRMENIPSEGNRPVRIAPRNGVPDSERLKACPVISHPQQNETGNWDDALGPILESWEGHAADPAIRLAGASGGALTALAAYCLEREGMRGVLHVGRNEENPLLNRTVFSRSREELAAQTGSRYSPASVCDGLGRMEEADGPCVFIGQPTEVVALRKAQAARPALAEKVGVALSFFCAGSPATQGTTDLLRKHGIDPVEVERLRYRGRGWPGKFAVWLKGRCEPSIELTYKESWAFLQAYRPWSVHLWPDGSGEMADISCGDPWYREIRPGEPGSSLIVARTETGRRIIRGAIESGYLEAAPAEPWKVKRSQENLLAKKGAIWGRLLTLKLLGLPRPRVQERGLFRLWLRLPLRQKLQSTFGTLRRIAKRKYYVPSRAVPGAGATQS